ncbi:MAG: LysM peptidoglycan-binding domain-containing M23 family metallopeptidase [Anaerolineae bacterium]
MDWRAKSPLLVRVTAHVTIVALALAAIGLSGVSIPAPRIAAGGSSDSNSASSPAASNSLEQPTPSPIPVLVTNEPDTIGRRAVPHTTFPDRPRVEVITYTVQQDDTIFTIAAQFGLAPETLVWSNREAIQDAPWLIQPGLQLFILPADGVYHTVRAGETVQDIADQYEVDPSTLYNEWNDLTEGEPLQEGQLLVVPDGTSEEVTWKPPQPVPSQPLYSYRYSASSVAAPAPNNSFILPTGSRLVSGWYFHDPRNPTHIGIDYKCRLGDPLYASDNGAVTIAGWHGAYGILVEINHGNGFVTRYGHLSQLAIGGGQAVNQGSIIGYCGSTGWSTGAHLHFEIRRNGVPQDPLAYQ